MPPAARLLGSSATFHAATGTVTLSNGRVFGRWGLTVGRDAAKNASPDDKITRDAFFWAMW
jgi:hypothetical protein